MLWLGPGSLKLGLRWISGQNRNLWPCKLARLHNVVPNASCKGKVDQGLSPGCWPCCRYISCVRVSLRFSALGENTARGFTLFTIFERQVFIVISTFVKFFQIITGNYLCRQTQGEVLYRLPDKCNRLQSIKAELRYNAHPTLDL